MKDFKELKKFKEKKCEKALKEDLMKLDEEFLQQLYRGIRIYRDWLFKYTADKTHAEKKRNEFQKLHDIIAIEIIRREEDAIPY